MARDYYEILNVGRDAGEKEIRSAFRRAARKHHPDLNRDNPEAATRFKEVNEAHEVLSDPDKRRLYDRYGHNWLQAQNNTVGGTPWSNFDPFSYPSSGQSKGFFQQMFGGGAGLNDLFQSTFSQGRYGKTSSRVPPRRNRQIVEKIRISLKEAFEGSVKALGITTNEDCSSCRGNGISAKGQCSDCSGSGIIRNRVRGEVTIPPGIKEGARLKVIADGKEVILIVSIRPSRVFDRNGSDLTCDVEVPLYDVVLGGETLVPTITGSVVLNLPSGTSNGQIFRLSGLGMPLQGKTDSFGSLFVRIKVKLPENLTEIEREQFQKLRAMRQM